MSELEVTRERAKAVGNKPAAFGPDLDLGVYTSEAEEVAGVGALRELPPEVKEKASGTGIDAGETARSGSFFQMNNSVLFASSREAGLEVMSTTEALKKYDWLKDYWWRAVEVDADKYTAQAELDLHHGYFIRALPGAKVSVPVQACLYLNREMFSQNVHNIILAEEGSELHISHEAAVGRIDEEEIQYLMARGLTAGEATSAIVRGFLDIDIKGLPEKLKEEIRRAVTRSDEAEPLF